jgi:hypothetical protein
VQVSGKEYITKYNDGSKSVSKHLYVKLHGSFNWRSADGSDAMVIGHSKEEQINKEALLKWYSEMFKDVLLVPNMKLMVIGYSFGDDHINKVIAEAVEKANLRLYIISPERPQRFIERMKGRVLESHTLKIVSSGLAGYYRSSFLDILRKTGDNFNIFDDYFS